MIRPHPVVADPALVEPATVPDEVLWVFTVAIEVLAAEVAAALVVVSTGASEEVSVVLEGVLASKVSVLGTVWRNVLAGGVS